MSQVKLISYSQPAPGSGIPSDWGLTELVAFCARVSNKENQYNTETAEKLIKYLVRNLHWSPLEMVNVCMEITTTRDIAHQIVRHRSFSFQEMSQRYSSVADMDPVIREARLQDDKNRQNSIETDDEELKAEWERMQMSVADVAGGIYQWALDNGIAKEQARVVLPEGLTPSVLYMNGTLRSWLHYIALRSANGTQKEHAEIARQCADELKKIFALDLTSETL